MTMCMARRNAVVLLPPALAKAILERRSIDHILYTINATSFPTLAVVRHEMEGKITGSDDVEGKGNRHR